MPSTQAVTQVPHSAGDAGSPQLSAVPSELQQVPGGRRIPGRPFVPGNKMQLLHKPRRDTIEELDEIARETVQRLRRRRDPDGKLREMDAPTANAIFVGLRLRSDLYAEYEAGEQLARVQAEIEQMQEAVARVLQERAR